MSTWPKLSIWESVSFSDGFVKDRSLVLDALREADAFVFPTAWEAFSVALIEAMGAPALPGGLGHPAQCGSPRRRWADVSPGRRGGACRAPAGLARDPEAIAREADRAYERAQSFLPDRCYPSTLVAYEDALSGGSGEPRVDGIPVDDPEPRVDVLRAGGLKVQVVRVLVDVQREDQLVVPLRNVSWLSPM